MHPNMFTFCFGCTAHFLAAFVILFQSKFVWFIIASIFLLSHKRRSNNSESLERGVSDRRQATWE